VNDMIEFNNAKEFNYPFPHIIIDKCFDKETLDTLLYEFPNTDSQEEIFGGRKQIPVIKNHINTNNNLEKSKPYQEWIPKALTWKKFYDWLNSDVVFHKILTKYESDLKKWGCVVDKSSSLKKDCFLHIDWSVATDGYSREIHRDSDKRIWSFLIFLSDKNWNGGDTLIHSSDNLTKYPRHIWDNSLPVHKTIKSKTNTGVFFLSTPNSYHSVSKQFNTKSSRNFIYGSYSVRNGAAFKK